MYVDIISELNCSPRHTCYNPTIATCQIFKCALFFLGQRFQSQKCHAVTSSPQSPRRYIKPKTNLFYTAVVNILRIFCCCQVTIPVRKSVSYYRIGALCTYICIIWIRGSFESGKTYNHMMRVVDCDHIIYVLIRQELRDI